MRACLSRSEDLALLQRLAAGEVPGVRGRGAGGAGLQMVLECEYREEWRRGREAEALRRAPDFTLEHVSGKGGRQALADRVLALNEMLEEEDRLARARQLRRGGGAVGPSPYASSTRRAAATYGRPSTAGGGGGRATASSRGGSARPALSQGALGGAVLVPGRRSNGDQRPLARPATAPHRKPGGGSRAPARAKGSGGQGGWPRAVPTHKKLLEIQRGLDLGLTDFKDAEGIRSALEALRGNLDEAQGHFEKRVEATRTALQAEEAEAGRRPGPRGRGWDLLARLGHFGLHSNDLAAAESLRRHRAARTIQRASAPLRSWLADRRAQEETRARAERARAERWDTAATTVQSHFRRRMALREASARRVARAKLRLSSSKILRAFRWARNWRRVLEGASREGALAAAEARAWRDRLSTSVEGTRERQRAWVRPPLRPGTHWAAVVALQAAARGFLARAEARRRRAAGLAAQAAVRGWLGRRAVRWPAVRARLRQRRAVAAAWAEHVGALAGSWDVQRQAMQEYAALGRELRLAEEELQREDALFTQSWQAYESKLKRAAFRKPLPKGWIPQVDGVTGKGYYLYLKSGELHAVHPNLHAILPRIEQEREKALGLKRARLQRLSAYVTHLEQSSLRIQTGALAAISRARSGGD